MNSTPGGIIFPSGIFIGAVGEECGLPAQSLSRHAISHIVLQFLAVLDVLIIVDSLSHCIIGITEAVIADGSPESGALAVSQLAHEVTESGAVGSHSGSGQSMEIS